jgi:hypothetical protein
MYVCHDKKNAHQRRSLKGIVPHLQENGISILQYVDDTIFLLEEVFENARNLKFLLCLLEQISGLIFLETGRWLA